MGHRMVEKIDCNVHIVSMRWNYSGFEYVTLEWLSFRNYSLNLLQGLIVRCGIKKDNFHSCV